MSSLRLARQSVAASLRRSAAPPAGTRLLHSTPPVRPVDPTSPLEQTPAPGSNLSPVSGTPDVHAPAPARGPPSYVAAEPEIAGTRYDIPAGAFPTSAPYANFAAAAHPATLELPHSAASATPAHPLARRLPHNASGVGASAAVRHAAAPGELGAMGGGGGGLGVMDAAGTQSGDGPELPEVNAPPLFEDAVKYSKLGVKNAWKERK